jgi:hypothetical protein
MVNVIEKKQALRNALMDQDAFRVAQVFELPPIVVAGSGSAGSIKEPRKHNPQSLMVGDTDYGSLLTSLLDATAAAEIVSVFVSFALPSV